MNSTHHSTKAQRGLAAAPLLLLVGMIAAVVLYVVISNRQVSDGPKEVIWDKAECAYCAMHVGDPRFAAQLTTENGDTYFYDDPGCLFFHEEQLEKLQTAIHSRWFRHMRVEQWLEAADVAFERTDHAPMDFGFGAVAAGSPGSVSLEIAAAEVLAQ